MAAVGPRPGIPLAVIVVAALIVPLAPATADTPATITISVPEYGLAGGHATMLGSLRQSGVGLAAQSIDIWRDGERVGTARTDLSGGFTFNVPLPASVGRVSVQATWLTGQPVEERGPVRTIRSAFPPGPPSAPTAAETTLANVDVAWGAPTDDGGAPVTQYVVLRKVESGGWIPVRTQAASALSWTDTSAPPADWSSYAIVARNPVGDGPASGATTLLLRPAATELLATFRTEDAMVDLRWNERAGRVIGGFHVDRDGARIAALDGSTMQLIDGPFPPSSLHSYQVTAWNAAGDGPPSAFASVTTPPGAPLDLNATVRRAEGAVDLTWSAPAEPGPAPPTSYVIERSKGTAWSTLATIASLGYADADVDDETTYQYRVIAVNAGGKGPASSPMAITTPVLGSLAASVPQLQVCVPDGTYDQCVLAKRDQWVRYRPDVLKLGPRVHGKLLDGEGEPREGKVVYVVANISWEGAVRGSADKYVHSHNLGMIDTFVYPAAVWSDLPYGQCRDISALVTIAYKGLVASDSYGWRICHDL